MSSPESRTAPAPYPKSKRYLAFAIAAAAAGSLVVMGFQKAAADTDYQQAFIASAISGGVTVVIALLLAQRSAYHAGRRWLLPKALTLAMVVAIACFRFNGFSGEMVPQFTWRFAAKELPGLQPTTSSSTDDARPDSEPGSALESDAVDVMSTTINTPSDWPCFLGIHADGIVRERQFAIPDTEDAIETRWHIGVGSGWASFAMDQALAVTLEERPDGEFVTAYDLKTGRLRWSAGHDAHHQDGLGGPGPRTTPCLVGNRVFAQGASGRVWCLHRDDGRVLWSVDLLALGGWDQQASEEAIPWGRAASPVIVQRDDASDLCLIPLGAPEGMANRSLVALDAATGDVVWTTGTAQISYATPQIMTLGGVRQIVSVNEATITGHTIDSGATIWSFDWYGQTNTGANCASVVPAGDNRFLIGKGYGGGSAVVEIRAAGPDGDWTATEVWRSSRVMKTKFNHAVVLDGTAYGLSNGALEAVNVTTGDRLWQQPRRGRYGQGHVIAVEDTLIVQAENGDVALVEANPDAFRERLRFPALQSKTWNIPSLSGRTLLIRNGEEAMALRFPSRQ